MGKKSNKFSAREREILRMEADIEKWTKNHGIRDLESVSFRYVNPKDSHYHMQVTWVNGHVFMAGDCGDLVLTHYQALSCGAVKSLYWVAHSSLDYLLSKTSAKKVIDVNGIKSTIASYIAESDDYGYSAEQVSEMREVLNRVCEISDDYGDMDAVMLAVHESSVFDDFEYAYKYEWQDKFKLKMLQKAAKSWLDKYDTSSSLKEEAA